MSTEIQNKINAEYKAAMLAKDEDKKTVLNTLRAELKNKEIELRPKGKELTDEDVMAVIQKTIKQNTDANALFAQGGRDDLVERNLKANDILSTFLPKQLNHDEIDSIVGSVAKELNVTSMKDMGKLMAHLKANYAGQIDFGYVSKSVKELLG